jgi:ABC-2 type transport system permease protein
MTNTTAPTSAATSVAPARPRRSLREWLTRNPVTLKELRGRMRGARAFVVLIVYLLLMSAFVSLLYALYVSSGSNFSGGYNAGPDRQLLGKFVFAAVVGIELLLVCFICPAFTVGAISGERERQTYDLLRTTLLRARTLVFGKLVSSLSYAALLLVAALPLQSLAFLLGGVAAEEVVVASVLLLTTAFLYSAAGIFFSSFMRRTLGATIVTYAFVLLDTLGLPIVLLPIAALGSGLTSSWFQGTPPLLVQGLMLYGAGLLIASNPLATAIAAETILMSNQTVFYFTTTLTDGNGNSYIAPLVSPWLPWAGFSLALGALMVMLSIFIIKRGER